MKNAFTTDPVSARYPRGTISLGPRCNNRCIFCFYAAERGHPDLTTGEAFTEIAKARKAISGDILTFSGGEPALRPDIADLCAEALRLGFRGVHLQTNARPLADERLVKTLVQRGLCSCFVSLHGHTPSLYAALTGAQTGFAEAVKGLRYLERIGVPFTINVVITRGNFRYLLDIYGFLRSTFHTFRSLRLSYPRFTGAALANFHRVAPRFSDICPYLHQTIERAKQDGVDVLCDLIPTCVLGPHAECDIARRREPFYISDRWPGGPLGTDYALKYAFCLDCAARAFCCGVPLEYARRFPYRSEFKPFHVLRFTHHASRICNPAPEVQSEP